MKIHSLENTGSISVDGVDIISLNPNGTIQIGTQTVFTSASYVQATATGGTITNQTIGNQIINGDLIVTGSLTAQQFIVSSSVTYLTTSFASGSTKFGDTLDDIHGFTGSLSISGSLIINGASYNTTTSGTSGTNGTAGSGGTSGSSGTDGTGGTSGSSGTNGTGGTSGTNGTAGSGGTSGANGSSGDTGSSGSAGTSGTNGTAGSGGTSGADGSSGATGSSGSAGTSGTNGTAGSGGTSGTSGSSGATGSSGSAGTSGTATTSTRVEENFIATAGQTTFTVTGGYTVGLVDVFVNGVRFLPTEYTATNGTTVVFGSGLLVNDEVTIINYTSVIVALPTSRNVQDFTATSGQTTFTVTNGYIVGLLDVFVNGSKLTSSEFTATNGTTFVLTIASTTGDQVQSINYTASVNGVSGAGTTNELAYYTASSTLSSLTTATYPSLTELSYVKGVTSSLQTQLNAKAATLSGTTNNLAKFTSSSAIGNSAITDDGTTVTLVSRALSGTSATFSSSVTSDDLILTAGTLFGTGVTGFSNRLSDTTLYLQMPATGFNITDNALNTRFILSSAGQLTSTKTSGVFLNNSSGGTNAVQLQINNTSGDLRLGIESYTGGTIQVGTSAYAAVFGNQANNATQFTTNGTVRATITSGGSLLMTKNSVIGVNTSDGSDDGYLALCGASGDGPNRGGTIILSGNERADEAGQVVIGAGNVIGVGSVIAFRTAAAERMRLIGNGRLLIGTSTDQGYLLYVNGNAAGSSGFANVSDGRFKKDITPIESALTKVNQLNGISFNWNKDSRPDLNLDDKNHLGLIAQDVEAILPQVVSTGEDELQTKIITYSDIVPVLIEAIKELSAKVTLLENN